MGVRDDGEELAEGANRGGPGDKEQFVEQLDGVVEAEASRVEAVGDDVLQLQASVAHAAGHADGVQHGWRVGCGGSVGGGGEAARAAAWSGRGMESECYRRRFMRWLVGRWASGAAGPGGGRTTRRDEQRRRKQSAERKRRESERRRETPTDSGHSNWFCCCLFAFLVGSRPK